MIQGTMSNAGKSLLAAGLCRIFKQDGYRVAPFKSQNMALNSYITSEGLEMGRAQVVQAQAAGCEPSVDMNPILLKPSSDVGSQVIVRGVPIGTMPAKEYFKYKKQLIPEIKKAFQHLSEQYDIIVIEGAGSPAEINLKSDDIVNMGMARMAGAPVLLAGDIDRGGVFAQLYGTVALLEPDEQAMVKGLIINKFRGDKTILDPGVEMIEKLCKIPVVGVVPYMDVDIEDEDSLSSRLSSTGRNNTLKQENELSEKHVEAWIDIAAIRFPRLSNFTDLNVFDPIPGVSVRYVSRLSELGRPDLIVLPGTKNTIEDLLWMRQNGLEAAVLKKAAGGTPIWGICGGYQLMGQEVLDPDHVEGEIERLPGLGLLPVSTRMTGEKVTRQVNFQLLESCRAVVPQGNSSPSNFNNQPSVPHFQLKGYEIHMGSTVPVEGASASPLNRLESGQCDGYIVDRTCMGTYIHGILDNPEFIDFLLEPFAGKLSEAAETFNYRQFKEEQYDKLADHVRQHVNLPLIYKILTDNN